MCNDCCLEKKNSQRLMLKVMYISYLILVNHFHYNLETINCLECYSARDGLLPTQEKDNAIDVSAVTSIGA